MHTDRSIYTCIPNYLKLVSVNITLTHIILCQTLSVYKIQTTDLLGHGAFWYTL